MVRVTKKRKRTGHLRRALISTIIGVGIVVLFAVLLHGHPIPVLEPSGIMAEKERDLIVFTAALGMFVVIPVFILLFSIAWKYRATNTDPKLRYEPDFKSRWMEITWWAIPCVIILTLAIIMGIATHELDPYKPLDSKTKPVTVEVVALQWRWLFIYPDQGIATMNYMNIPENTPINLKITSDAPMNSFWVPALSGQVYAMSGMTTQLHIEANKLGSFNGSSANISGDGFSDMTFKVNSLKSSDFTAWTKKSANSPDELTFNSYKKLAKPTIDQSKVTYTLMDNELYNKIIAIYMPAGTVDSGTTKQTVGQTQ